MSDEQPRAVIFGCAGERLSAAERQFFAAAGPVGFILFRRNCRNPAQLRDLVGELRTSIGRDGAPVLIDQEGGRVARLGPPHWRTYPAPARLAALPDPLAEEAVWLGARLIADDLATLGITVDCLPALDLPTADADPVIGDRAYASVPERVARLGRAACDGLLAGAVLPVIKHIPGHGRARVDSHRECPVVAATHDELARSDFVPFRALAHMPWAMTAHVTFAAIDPRAPATLSLQVIAEIVRREIGFGGVLVSDDLSMGALGGSLAERTRQALAAGCDLVLHCTGNLAEMEAVAEVATPVSAETAARLARGEARRGAARRPLDRHEAERRFDALLDGRTAEVAAT